MFAEIIPLTKISLSKPQSYTYDIDGFVDEIKIGQLVDIPLYNRQALGIISSLKDNAPAILNKHGDTIIYKKIISIRDPEPLLNDNDITLAKTTSKHYYSSLGIILKHVIPEPLKRINKPTAKILKQINFHNINNNSNKTNQAQTILITGTATERQTYYLDIINQAIAQKTQVLLLVPEITLLAQMQLWLESTLSNEKIIVLHSSRNKTQSLINWRIAQTNGAQIFIGTRKAIFTSFYNLKNIIIDEEADLSYKQWDMNPRYDARLIAMHKARLSGSALTFGSATPSITNYLKTKYNLFPVKNLNAKQANRATIVDMRYEFQRGNYGFISTALLDSITHTLNHSKQTLLFTNRRAASNAVICCDCGHVLRCPNCNIALMEHVNNQLSCNHCSIKMISPVTCPKCHSPKIKSYGVGTEKVEQYLSAHFPQAVIKHLDVGKSLSLKQLTTLLREWQSGKIDILITTQTGIRLTAPNLKLIGAISIDSILNFPDWRSDEKAWQIISNLTNRSDGAQVIIQTYQPDSALLNITNQNEFHNRELINRKRFNYPPYVRMIKLTCKSDDHDFLHSEVTRVIQQLRQVLPPDNVNGPITPINPKIRYFWHKHIIIKLDLSHQDDRLKDILVNLSNAWSIDVDPLT